MQTLAKVPNAKKWTEERVKEHLIEIRKDSYNGDVDYLGIALAREGLYPQLWAYWKKAFADHEDIIEEMMVIEGMFEARLYQAALRKQVSPWIAVFGLKYNHHWRDEPVAETKSKPEEEPASGKELRSICVYELADDRIIITSPDLEYGEAPIYQRIKKAAENG
jgi:hypothetical protein